LNAKITGELDPLNGGTHLKWRIRLEGILPRSILRLLSRITVNKVLEMSSSFENLEVLSKKQLDKTTFELNKKTTSM